MKERRPVNIVETDQAGFHVSGWKSDMERHKRVFGLNRPDGVVIYILGGLNGYSAGKTSFPW